MSSFLGSRRLVVALVVVTLVAVACGSGGGTNQAATEPAVKEKPGRCDWKFNTVAFWDQNPPVASEGDHHNMGNSHGAQVWSPMVDTTECATLESEMHEMDAVMTKYPTAQAALDAGCYRATVYVPGIAAHYVCRSNFSPTAVLDKPLMLLYAGSQPTAPIVGLSYMIYSEGPPNEDPDAALWARYMPWHFHDGLCVNPDGLVIGGDNSDPTTCEARGGTVRGQTGWMGHYWPDNCPSPDGVFSADNPRLDPQVGQYNDAPENAANTAALVDAPCAGSTMPIDPAGGDRFGKPEGMGDRAHVDHAAKNAGSHADHTGSAD